MQRINENYSLPRTSFRNDIYRKFEKQFIYIFNNSLRTDEGAYVEHDSTEYTEAFNIFFDSSNSDIKFFVGYTGTGKSTFIRHYFGIRTLGITIYKEKNLVIPISWDGRTVPDTNYAAALNAEICNVLDQATNKIYKSVEEIMLNECDQLVEFIANNRPGILPTLTLPEIRAATQNKWTINQYKILLCQQRTCIELSSSILKYAVTKTDTHSIEQLYFIVDDVETISQIKLAHIVNSYFKIYDCMHNVQCGPYIKILFSLRPHSYRYLNKGIKHQQITSFGHFFDSDKYKLIKNSIPSIKKIFIARFNNALNNTPKPGNQSTWDLAKNTFFDIINNFDNDLLQTICQLCHLDIRAVSDCFQLVLSNRVWCQEHEYTHGIYPVRQEDYRFDAVSVIRTLSCGENPVYTGMTELQFNNSLFSDFQRRPTLDNSKAFIPNILADVQTGECDVFPILIVQYLNGFFSSVAVAPPHTEFIFRKTLTENLLALFNDHVTIEKINLTIDYLFENRVIRKSIISEDDDDSINTLLEDDGLYLTLKGDRLLAMLESDSVYLEILREDIKRDYSRVADSYYKSSLELITENKRQILFDDLIRLCKEIYYSEDEYQSCVKENPYLFSPTPFPITNRAISGVRTSINRAQTLQNTYKSGLVVKLSNLEKEIQTRSRELGYR